MMKQTIHILASCLFLASCGQADSKQISAIPTDTPTDTIQQQEVRPLAVVEEIEEQISQASLDEFEKATLYKLTDTIKADFNGDGVVDWAFYKKENTTSGIIIRDGQTKTEHRIGFGQQFAHMTELDWIDYWGLVEDKETTETTFDDDGDVLGEKNIKLQNPSIVVGANELGGGLITYLNGKYEWIHQTC